MEKLENTTTESKESLKIRLTDEIQNITDKRDLLILYEILMALVAVK